MTTTVLGAGYAGIMAANRLAGHGEEVALVTPHPWFVERIRLHTVASGARTDARRDLATLLHPAVAVVTDTVTRIDENTLELRSGASLPYETLVYAVGSGAEAASGAYRVASETDAVRLRAALRSRPDARVTVVGAGLTGIEIAAALREAGRRVRVVTAAEPHRRAARAQLQHLHTTGVEVVTGCRVDVAQTAGEEITVDATGFVVPSLTADSGLPTDARGRLLVDETLTVPGRPRIIGAGDAVRINADTAAHLRPACATALPMGAHAADVVLARREGMPGEPFALGYTAQCVDLAGGRGHVQFVHPDDSERSLALTGRTGGLFKEAVCRLTVRWLAQERQRAGRYSWPAGPARAVPAGFRAQ